MQNNAKKLATTVMLTALAIGATMLPGASESNAAEPFGPVESRTFAVKAGTTIERPSPDCPFNYDFLFVKGKNVGKVKNADVHPKVWVNDRQNQIPTTECTGSDCAQIYISVMKNTPVGPRTVTLKHADGRETTTTFEVVENVTANCGRKH